MSDDAFDTLVDDATHAVNNLIPDAVLNRMSFGERSALLVAVNDALAPILRDVIGGEA
jgi:hypothetical protein